MASGLIRLGMVWALAVFLAACAAPGDRKDSLPDWVTGSTAAYPQTGYLLGYGTAPDRALAQERARADLIKQLRVAVASRHAERQTFIEEDGREKRSLAVERRIESRAEAELSGVTIAEIWRDSATGTYHALAALPRAVAAQDLRGRIAALDRETMAKIRAARENSDPLAALAAAQAAVQAQEGRQVQSRLLEAVAGVAPIPPWPLARLRADRDALLARLRITVAGDEGDDALVAIAEAVLAAAGLQLAAPGLADYRLNLRLSLLPPRQRDGWYWVRGRLTVTLEDNDDGRSRGSHEWPFKAAGQSIAVARDRARREANRLLREELMQILLGFASQP